MPRPSKKVVKKTLETKLLGRPSRLKQRLPWTFFHRSARWMFAAPRDNGLSRNLTKITPGTEASFRSPLTRHKLCLLIAQSAPRPRDLARTTKKVGAIEIVAIAASTALGLTASPWPIGLTQPRFRRKTIMILATTGQRVGKIGTWAGPPIIIVTKTSISLNNLPSPASQKTIISLGDLLVGDWC